MTVIITPSLLGRYLSLHTGFLGYITYYNSNLIKLMYFMLVVYFKDDSAIFRKHGFSLLVTSAKYEDSSKSQIDNISAKRENNEKTS